MATYAIGDIQGCLAPLESLLKTIEFNPRQDTLWIAGDMVNRGPQSLETLRFLYELQDSVVAVLGNHDLHLLAVDRGWRQPSRSDTLNDILNAPDKNTLLDWVRAQPLVHCAQGYTMVHAGIPPQWSIKAARAYAREVETVIRGDGLDEFLAAMYGNTPAQWRDDLQGMDRLRAITNYFTRMRICNADGDLELSFKGSPEQIPEGFKPWFEHPNRLSNNEKIIFGHWAALQGKAQHPQVFALDTGCVWGQSLTAMRLEDQHYFRTHCNCSP